MNAQSGAGLASHDSDANKARAMRRDGVPCAPQAVYPAHCSANAASIAIK
jgi:hypothetical protein